MPSKSKKQHDFMAAVANNPEFAEKAGVPQSVGKEYMKADEGKKFKKGGSAGFPDLNKDGKVTRADVLKGRGVEGFRRGGGVRGMKCPRDGVAMRGRTRGQMR